MFSRNWFYRQMVLMWGKGMTPAEKADHLYGNWAQMALPALEKSIAEWVAGQEEINMQSVGAHRSLAQWIMKGEIT